MAKALSRKVTIYINGKEVEATISSLTAKIKQLENEQKKLPIGTQEYINKSMELKELRAILHEQKVAVNDLGDHWLTMGEKVANASNMIMGVQSIFQMIDLSVGKLKDLAKDAAALDDVYADVMKTTGLTHEQVEKLNETFKKMDTRTAREQLNQLAYEAGKLGINTEEGVAQFVSASDKINIALGDVLGDGAMVTIGKLADVYAKSTKQLSEAGDDLEKKMLAIGSAVNMLGQSSTANEGYLVEFLSRMGGIATQANLSADAILGFASALDQDMMKQEMSATAFQKFIMQMIKKPAEFAKAARMEVNQFTDLMQKDMNEALLKVLEGFQGKGGLIALQPIFEDLGLDAARAASVISSMANSIDQIREAQAIANSELTTGSSVINEFNTKNETMQAQAEKAKKRFEEVRIELGNELYPVLIHLQKTGTVFMKWFAALAQVVKNNRWILLSFTTALIALNYAKLKKIATDKLDAIQSRLSNTLTKTGTNLTKLHTAAQDRATLASLKLQKAKIALASSNKTVSYTIDGVRISSDKMTAARNIDLAITRQQTVANKSLGAAMKAMPWGWVITAVSVLAPLMYKLFTHQSKVNEAEKEAARQYGEAEGKLRVLKERMMGAKEGSAEYLEALNELKSEYPDIIQLHLDEKGAIRDLEAAYKDLSAAAKQSAYDRVYAEKTSEAYGDLAEKVASVTDKLRSQMDFRVTWDKKPAEAIKEEVRRFVAEQVRLIADGKKNSGQAMKDIEAFVKKYGGRISSMPAGRGGESDWTLIKAQLNEIQAAYTSTEATVKKYKDALKPDKTEEDPYGYAKMSLEELEKELASATSSMEDMKRQWDIWKKEAPDNPDTKQLGENYLHEKKRVEQLTAAIVRLKKAQGGGTTTTTTTSFVDPKEAAKKLKAWEKVKERAEKMTEKAKIKAESGLEKIKDDVHSKFEAMREEVREAAEAAGRSADATLEKLDEAERILLNSKIDEFIEKQRKEIEKLQRKTAKDSDNPMLNKVKAAAEQMKQELNSVAETISAQEDNVATLQDMLRSLRDVEGDEAEARREQLRQQIGQFNIQISQNREIQKMLVASAFASIDTSVDTSDFGKKQQVQHHESTIKSVENLSGIEKFLGVGKSYATLLDEINEKYDKYRRKLEQNIEAEKAMAQAARKAGNEDEAKKHEANAAALEKEKEGLEGVKEEAEKIARQKSLSKTLEKWADMIGEFGDKALSVFANINSLLKNIADSRLQELEEEKDAEIETLDEQLEQGLISQEDYEKRKKELEDNYEKEAEKAEKEAWRREQTYAYSEAVINAALAAIKLWAGEGTTAYKIGMSALLAAEMATQIAAIANQPEPYARGGYVRKETVYKAGEAGPEWVASNRLLKDPQTAPMIKALEAYQRGDRRALADIPMAQLNMPVVTAAARELGRRNAGAIGAEVVSGWKPSQQKVTVEMPGGDETMQLWRDLAEYLKDPKNRVAVISRQTMKDFEDNENFLRSKARL